MEFCGSCLLACVCVCMCAFPSPGTDGFESWNALEHKLGQFFIHKLVCTKVSGSEHISSIYNDRTLKHTYGTHTRTQSSSASCGGRTAVGRVSIASANGATNVSCGFYFGKINCPAMHA